MEYNQNNTNQNTNTRGQMKPKNQRQKALARATRLHGNASDDDDDDIDAFEDDEREQRRHDKAKKKKKGPKSYMKQNQVVHTLDDEDDEEGSNHGGAGVSGLMDSLDKNKKSKEEQRKQGMTAEISRANGKQLDRRQGQLASLAGGAQRNGGDRKQKKPKRTMKPTNFAEQNARRKQQEKQDQSYSNEASWKKKINKVGGRLNFQGRGRRDTQHMRGNTLNRKKTKQKQHSDPDYNPHGSKKRKKQDD